MSYQLQGLSQLTTAQSTTGTVTFSSATTNAFLVDNTNGTVFAYVNVYNASATPSDFHHPASGSPGASIVIPPNTGRVIVGNFGSSGGWQDVYVKTITNASSAILIVSPVTLVQAGTSL